VRRWLAIVAGGFGLAAYIRVRSRRPARAQLEPAEELRAKLARSRLDQPREHVGSGAALATEPASAGSELDERRRDVHDRARQTIDELG
jgi:hypothetical protein